MNDDEELLDLVAGAVDNLIAENSALKIRVDALERLVLSLAITHPNKDRMLSGYTERLQENVPLLDILSNAFVSDVGDLFASKRRESLLDYIDQVKKLIDQEDLAN